MPNYAKLAKGLTSAIKGEQKVLPKAEREENLAKFLDRSRVKERLYHATPSSFKEFKPGGKDPTISGPAIWLSNNPRHQPAMHNIAGRESEFREGVNVMPVHVQARNPLLLDDPDMLHWAQEVFAGGSKEFPELLAPKWVEELRKEGYDSIMFADPYKNRKAHEVIMFEPNKIKSAIGNKGTYDVTKPDINEAKGGRIKMGAGGLAKGVKAITSLVKGTQEVLPAAERKTNLAKMLEPSVEKRRMYHGTYADDIKKFKTGKNILDEIQPGNKTEPWADSMGTPVRDAVFVTPNPQFASTFIGDRGVVYPVYAQVKNPWDFENPKHREAFKAKYKEMFPSGKGQGTLSSEFAKNIDKLAEYKSNWEFIEEPEVQKVIKSLGHDAFYVNEISDGNIVKNLGIYEPSKIKSAIGNKGTYDVTKPDINEAKGGSVKMAAGGVSKAAKAITSLLKGSQDVLPAAEREANLAKFLEQSKTPMRLYHGTTATEAGKGTEAISRLKPSKEGSLGSGVYLTPKPEFAGQYASTAGGNVLPVHAQLRNPLIIEGKHGDPMIEALMKLGMDESKAAKMVERAYENKGYIGKEVENRARAAGYDGLMQYRNGELGEVVSYNPNAVKSAIGNKGTYDVYNQDLNKASGGVINMAAGGLSALAKLGKALSKSEEATLRARGLGVPGVDFADPLKAPSMRMSEALGNVGAEGKTLNFTEADRSRVFGPNRGGVGFSALQHYSEPHKEARTVWGFGNESVAKKKINQNDPDNTIWTTYAGSPEQHKSNTVVVKDAIKTLQEANKAGAIHPEQVRLINQRINQAVNDNGKPLFPAGFDITDPQALSAATTFDRRAVISDALMGIGVKKPMISKEFKEANPGVKWKDASNIGGILARETDPALVNAKTFDVGPNLFVMDNKIIHRPDLNEAFPVQVTGEDLGMRFNLAPFRNAAPDFIKKKGYGPNDPINAWAMSRGVPNQFVNETYLTDLQKAGYKDGGEVSDSFANRWKAALEAHMADGGEVGNWQDALAQRDSSFADRLKSALEQHMAEGGEVSDNTVPDMTDGGNVNYANGFADGGSAEGAPSATRQMFNNAIAMGKEALEAEYKLLKDPAARADILKRIGLTIAGSGPDLMNLLASGVDLAQEQIPFLRKKVPESIMDEVMPMAYKRPSSYAPKFPLSSNEVPGGAEHQIRNAQEAGLLGEAKAPITETIASLAGPFAVGAAARTAAKTAKAAPTVAKKLVNEMLTPMSPKAAQRGAIGWHGTPHKFPPTEKNPLGEFDPTKIGSGEGAQAYGYGHYTAEAPDVAKGYAETLANRNMANQGRLNAHANAQRLANLAGDPKYAADDIKFALETNPDHPQKSLLQETLGFLESGKYAEPLQSKGTLYKIDIPDEQVAKMLDWDKPLKEQDIFKSGLLKEIAEDLELPAHYRKAALLESRDGEDLNNVLSQALGSPKKAAEYLQSWGIPGVKYLDQQSRGASGTGKWLIKFKDGKEKVYDFKPNDDVLQSMGATAEPTGTRNFVVFPGNESMMNIVERHKRGGLAQAKG